MRQVLRRVTTLFLFAVLFGCASSDSQKHSIKNDKELNELLEAYKAQQAQAQERRKALRDQSIKNLTVEKLPEGFAVSADLINAPIPEVVQRLLTNTGVPYLLDNVTLGGYVTSRFSKLSLPDALNLILEPIVLEVDHRDGAFIIRSGLQIEETALPGTTTVQTEVVVKNLDLDTVSQLFNGLYPVHPATGSRGINYGPVSNTNTLYISGPRDEVIKAVRMLKKADCEIRHVMMEVVVIEFDSDEFLDLESSITDFASRKFSGTNLRFGSLSNDNVSFTRDSSARNPTKFTAILDLLIGENKARLISRPYVSTLSGKMATIDITNNRYIKTPTAFGGAAITAPAPISSGVVLKITPTVLSEDIIRLKIYLEDSQFVEPKTSGNVDVEVKKSTADTLMQIEDGQTIIVGGLVLNRREWTNTGFPWLRNIPVLNLFFAKQSGESASKEVAIYITPHVWDPNIGLPIVNQDAFIKEDEEGLNK